MNTLWMEASRKIKNMYAVSISSVDSKSWIQFSSRLRGFLNHLLKWQDDKARFITTICFLSVHGFVKFRFLSLTWLGVNRNSKTIITKDSVWTQIKTSLCWGGIYYGPKCFCFHMLIIALVCLNDRRIDRKHNIFCSHFSYDFFDFR